MKLLKIYHRNCLMSFRMSLKRAQIFNELVPSNNEIQNKEQMNLTPKMKESRMSEVQSSRHPNFTLAQLESSNYRLASKALLDRPTLSRNSCTQTMQNLGYEMRNSSHHKYACGSCAGWKAFSLRCEGQKPVSSHMWPGNKLPYIDRFCV